MAQKKRAPGTLGGLNAAADPADINLPDESSGKPVGRLPYGAKSNDRLKQSYMDRIRERNKARGKFGYYDNRPQDSADDTQQEDQSREIFGGDEDDPRWKEHLARVAAANKKAPATLGGSYTADVQQSSRFKRRKPVPNDDAPEPPDRPNLFDAERPETPSRKVIAGDDSARETDMADARDAKKKKKKKVVTLGGLSDGY